MGKGLEGDERAFQQAQVPEAQLSSVKLLLADLNYSFKRDARGGYVRLRHYGLPADMLPLGETDTSVWRVGYPYRAPETHEIYTLGGLTLLGADRSTGYGPVRSHGITMFTTQPASSEGEPDPAIVAPKLWQFNFAESNPYGLPVSSCLDVEQKATACLCATEGPTCPHQAFALFFLYANLLYPTPSLTHVGESCFEAWTAAGASGILSGQLLLEAVAGYYQQLRAHPQTFIVDSARLQEVLES